MILLTVTRKYQSDFIFCIDLGLDLPQTIVVFDRQNTDYLESIYLEAVAQSSSMKKVFLKFLQNWESTCAGVSSLIKFQVGGLLLY